ncbi:MAG TPA: hypothetical protein VKU44_06835 [Terriglobia bacterium]|nr:hypothetical protein [Terriglobia bacterium]
MARDSKQDAAYASGMRGSEKKGEQRGKPKEEAERITIRPAENGYQVECSYPPKDSKAPYSYQEPKAHVFKTAEEVADFVRERLGVKE